jgi:hypothetical protein
MIVTKTMLFAAVSTASILLACNGLMIMDNKSLDNEHVPLTERPRISVQLLRPASAITGMTVPAHIISGERPHFFEVNDPSVIAVILPDGKQISLPVKTAFVNVEVDVRTKTPVVVDVDLLPLPKAAPFREAIAELNRLMREMRIQPDERMQKKMATWPDDSRDFTYRAEVKLSESVTFLVKVRPSDNDEHFLVFTFAADGDARRAVWDPTFKAASKQSMAEKDKSPDQNPNPK